MINSAPIIERTQVMPMAALKGGPLPQKLMAAVGQVILGGAAPYTPTNSPTMLIGTRVVILVPARTNLAQSS